MKKERIEKALDYISDEKLAEALEEKKKKHTFRWVSAVAAVLAVAITVTALVWPVSTPAPGIRPPAMQAAGLVAAPEYPQMAKYPLDPNSPGGYEEYEKWWDSQRAQYGQPLGYGDNLYDFYQKSIPVFLQGGEKNAVYSPVNVYMALAMLAETADGNTRQQILDLLNASSIESLRTQAGHMWNAHYCDDDATTLLLANSLWLDDTLNYKQATADILAKDYYASVFHGDLGSDAMNKALQDWLNENTGGLLKEQVAGQTMGPQTLLALASTIYYKVKWNSEFWEELNTEDVFHAPSGDKTVTYMNTCLTYGPYYYGEDYGAVSLRLEDGSRMWLILPDEGCTPADILKSGHAVKDLLVEGEPANNTSVMVNLSLPKFDVTAKNDIIPALKTIGITDAFSSYTADFSSVSDDPLFVSGAEHAARVKIDEKGLEAAAYTVLMEAGAAMPPTEEVDFILDRPFIFLIESASDMPLFTGVVNEP